MILVEQEIENSKQDQSIFQDDDFSIGDDLSTGDDNQTAEPEPENHLEHTMVNIF